MKNSVRFYISDQVLGQAGRRANNFPTNVYKITQPTSLTEADVIYLTAGDVEALYKQLQEDKKIQRDMSLNKMTIRKVGFK